MLYNLAHDVWHVLRARFVAHDLHTTAPWPLESMLCSVEIGKKFQIALFSVIIITIIIIIIIIIKASHLLL